MKNLDSSESEEEEEMNLKRCARCDAVLRYPEDAGLKGITIVDGSVCEMDVCGRCKETIATEDMERMSGIDDKSIQEFESMMVGYFGLRNRDDLYKLREIVVSEVDDGTFMLKSFNVIRATVDSMEDEVTGPLSIEQKVQLSGMIGGVLFLLLDKRYPRNDGKTWADVYEEMIR